MHRNYITRRRLLRGGVVVVAAALHGHPGWASLPDDDDAAMPPTREPRPFAAHLVPYATPEKMAEKLDLIRALPDLTRGWRATARTFAGLPRRNQLAAVSLFVNRVPYVADTRLFGVEDRWEDPYHFFGHGGDCEEFALAKYALLWHLGFHPARLHFLAVRRRLDQGGHAVLGVLLNGETYILDQSRNAVLPDHEVKGYIPVYVVNAGGIFVAQSIQEGAPVTGAP